MAHLHEDAIETLLDAIKARGDAPENLPLEEGLDALEGLTLTAMGAINGSLFLAADGVACLVSGTDTDDESTDVLSFSGNETDGTDSLFAAPLAGHSVSFFPEAREDERSLLSTEISLLAPGGAVVATFLTAHDNRVRPTRLVCTVFRRAAAKPAGRAHEDVVKTPQDAIAVLLDAMRGHGDLTPRDFARIAEAFAARDPAAPLTKAEAIGVVDRALTA